MKIDENHDLNNQIALIGKTARALAHELKTPLTSIRLNVEMLEDENLKPENRKRSFQLLKKEVTRLTEIIDSYLGLAGRGDLECQDIPLQLLVENAADAMESVFEKKNIKFNRKIDAVSILADRKKIESVLITMLSNSADAIGENGTIEMKSEIKGNGIVSLFLTDSGCGINETEKIFTPFYTTKPDGNGIGLVLASEIMKKHNGEIKLISSEPGRTIFEISFLLKGM